jgi:hypothetical protein
MSSWYGDLSPVEKRTILACWAGWVLDSMDLMIYSMVMPVLISLWQMTNAQAGLLATSAPRHWEAGSRACCAIG